MSVYSLQRWLNELSTELDVENKERQDMLYQANDVQGNYLYRKEASDIGMPKKLPPRYDMRKHDSEDSQTDTTESHTPSADTDTTPRKVHVSNLPESIKFLIKNNKNEDSRISGIILKKDKDGSIIVTPKGFEDHKHGLMDVLKSSIRVNKGHKDYAAMYTLFASGDLVKTKLSAFAEKIKNSAAKFSIAMPVWVDPESAIQLMAWKKAIVETADRGTLLKDENTVNYAALKTAFINSLDQVRVAKDVVGLSTSVKDMDYIKQAVAMNKEAGLIKTAEYWETAGARASDFRIGDPVMRYDGVLPGKVVAIHPGINFVDVEYPTGWEQEEPEELIPLALFGALPPAPKSARLRSKGTKSTKRHNNLRRMVYNINRFNPVYPYAIPKEARLMALVGAEDNASVNMKPKIAACLKDNFTEPEIKEARDVVSMATKIAARHL